MECDCQDWKEGMPQTPEPPPIEPFGWRYITVEERESFQKIADDFDMGIRVSETWTVRVWPK